MEERVYQPVVLRVGPDPEPDQPLGRLGGERPMAEPDAGRPEASDLLDVQRRVRGVVLEKGEDLVGELLNGTRKSPVASPEVR